MERESFERCNTLEECIHEIWKQNYISKNNKDGFSVEANTKIINSHFDVLFSYAENMFASTVQENTDEARKDGMLLMYDILIIWIEKKIKFKYTPTNVGEMIVLLYDMKKSKEICKYLCGCLQRQAKNLLYTSREKNGYSKNVYCTSEKNDKNYNNINYFELDGTYDDVSGYDIFELEQYRNGKYKEEKYNKNIYGFIYDNILSDRDRKEIDKKLDDSNYKCGVRANALIKRIEKNEKIYNNIKIENGKIVSRGDFLSFGNALMRSNDLVEKFVLISGAIDSDSEIGEILLDLITELDVKVYRQFFQHLKDDRYIKYYVKSYNFEMILNIILDEYKKQQERLKDIYVYNESMRKEKINIIKKMIKEKNNILNKNDFTKVYKKLIDLFRLERYFKKDELRRSNIKLELFRDFGFVFKKTDEGKYRLHSIAD